MLDTLLVLVLAGVCFYLGKTVSDRYHQDRIDEVMYLLRINTASKVQGYIPPYQKEHRQRWLGREFCEKLRTTGKAVQAIRK